jgi:hypothetical protein
MLHVVAAFFSIGNHEVEFVLFTSCILLLCWSKKKNVYCFAANLVLHRTIERIHVGKKYGDIPRGIFVVRGENVVLLGEIVSASVVLV